MSQHWKSLLVVLVIIGTIVFFYRGDKKEAQAETSVIAHEAAVAEPAPVEPAAPQPVVTQEASAPAPSENSTEAHQA